MFYRLSCVIIIFKMLLVKLIIDIFIICCVNMCFLLVLRVWCMLILGVCFRNLVSNKFNIFVI